MCNRKQSPYLTTSTLSLFLLKLLVIPSPVIASLTAIKLQDNQSRSSVPVFIKRIPQREFE